MQQQNRFVLTATTHRSPMINHGSNLCAKVHLTSDIKQIEVSFIIDQTITGKIQTKYEGNVGTKLWWNVKDKQGNTKDESIPPLLTKDGTLAASSEEKTDALGRYFSSKMT